MPKTYNSSTFSTTYRDDFRPGQGFHKVLFNSGRALQARELNQLQSIIHEEIARLGNHLFKNGAVVNPGGVTVNNGYEYVRLNPTGGQVSRSHVTQTITGQTSGVSGRIVQYVPGTSDAGDTVNVPTVYVQYESTTSGVPGSASVRFTPGEVLTCPAGNLTVESSNTETSGRITPTGRGTKVAVEKGTLFVLGHFVNIQRQALILSKYFGSYSGNIGFKIIQDILTTEDTVDLYDNQGATPNLTSPGADRYRIRLVLTKEENVLPEEDFVFLARIVDGSVALVGSGTNQYNKINDLLAKRTFEESGNYIVEPFTINFSEVDSADDTKLYLNVSKGVAYINGYRSSNPAPKRLLIPKPTSTETVNNEQIPIIYDRYFIVDTSSNSTHQGMLTVGGTVNLYNATTAGGSVIGTVKVRSIEKGFGTTNRVYIGKTLTKTADFRTARSIGTSSSEYYNIVLEGNPARAVIKGEERDKDLLFRLPRPRPSTIADISYVHIFQQQFTGNSTISTSAGNEFTDTSSWIVSNVSGSEGQVAFSVSLTSGGTQATFSGLLNGSDTYEVTGYKTLTNATAKNKFPTPGNTGLLSTTGTNDVVLNVHDVYEINFIRDSANGNNIQDYFIFDDGQRDTHYELSKLTKRYPYTGNVYVDYNYFARQIGGNFYTKNSYVSNPGAGLNISYDDIPSYTPKFDATTKLFNIVDFRPDLDAGGSLVNGTDQFFLPKRSTSITADVSYYLPRADKLMITEEGNLLYMKGVPDQNPQYKKTPEGSLDLYKVLMNANTLNPTDVKTTQIEARRYTMADIGKIERKVDRLEEMTTLSLLELDTKNLNVLDADGNLRTKSGFFVDNFADQTFSATTLPDYAAAVDMGGKVVRPSFKSDNIRLIYDSNASAGVVKKGDNVYLDYREIPWKQVNIASQSEPVNPFLVTFYEGEMILSPSSDEWKDTKYKGNKVIDGGTKVQTENGRLWNEHEWNWGGLDPNSVEVGDVTRQTSAIVGSSKSSNDVSTNVDDGTTTTQTDVTTTSTTTTTAHTVTRIVSSETVQEEVGDRVVQVAIIPWMRSRKIFFKAEGLRPNTRMYPFFDGVNVSNWCRQETTFVRWSDRTEDQGNQGTSKSVNTHPSGSSTLITDNKGELIGSFYIPNTRPKRNILVPYGPSYKQSWSKSYESNLTAGSQPGLRFACGSLEFKLLDITRDAESNAICKASSVYTAKGTLNTRQRSVLSTRILQARDTTWTSESTHTTTDTNVRIEERIEIEVPVKTEPEVSPGDRPSNETADDFGDQNDIEVIIDQTPDTSQDGPEIPELTTLPAEPIATDPIREAPVMTENNPEITIDVSFEGSTGIEGKATETIVEIPACINLNITPYLSGQNDTSSSNVTLSNVEGFFSGNTSEDVQIVRDNITLPASIPNYLDVSTLNYETTPTLVMTTTTSVGGATTLAQGTATLGSDFELQVAPIVQPDIQFDPGPAQTIPLNTSGNPPRNEKEDVNPATYPTKKTGGGARGSRRGGRGGNFDPVAQTFYVDNQYGVYITKVALYFSGKDDNIPVRVEIRPEVNGAPSSNISMISKTVAPADVNLPVNRTDIKSIRAAPTYFEFDEPIFLSPFSGYAICVIAPNTTAYQVYCSEMEKYILGSSTNRILKQPDLGSFFRSQNSRIWEPAQKIDMMYTLYRASFKRGGYVICNNADVPAELLEENPIYTTAGSAEIYVEHPMHGLLVNDKATITGLDSVASYGGILGTNIMGLRTVTAVDASGYTFNAGTTATATSIVGGDDVVAARNMQYNIANLYAETIVPNFTSVAVSGKFTSGKPYGGVLAPTGANTPYNKDLNWTRMTPRVNTTFSYPRIIANRYNEELPGNLNGARSATFKFDLKSVNGLVSPVLDLQRCSLTMIENIIDKQSESTNAQQQNIAIKFTSESDPSNGSHPAKHITSPITLSEDAVGLKVMLAANRPPGSEFQLWYRTAVEGEDITTISWTQDVEENEMPVDENPSIFREYTYLIGGDDGALESFSEFQLKIVFRAENSSKVPTIRDLRAIALVD